MERELIDWLRERLPPTASAPLGLRDDAAVLDWPAATGAGGKLVVTVDSLTDGVDFIVEEVRPEQIGRKALGVNLSDLAAMAANPVAAVISLVLPKQGASGLSTIELAKGIYEGALPMAVEFGAAIVGGDTNTWDGGLVISVTALGRTTAAGPLIRGGARPGDWVLVTGALGGSLEGRHLAVQPRIREAIVLQEKYGLTAGMDVSDGLALDASRLAESSRCGVALRLADIPVHDDAWDMARKSGRLPIEHALGDGEDFELLVTASPEVAQRIILDQPLAVPITRIGECIASPGLWKSDEGGKLSELAATGFVH